MQELLQFQEQNFSFFPINNFVMQHYMGKHLSNVAIGGPLSYYMWNKRIDNKLHIDISLMFFYFIE